MDSRLSTLSLHKTHMNYYYRVKLGNNTNNKVHFLTFVPKKSLSNWAEPPENKKGYGNSKIRNWNI